MVRPEREREIKIHGLNACLAVYTRRPEDIVRVWVTEATIPMVGDLLRGCARARVAYHVVPPEELEVITESRHHEGLCLLARRHAVELEAVLEDCGEAEVVLVLDGVGNPHNLGAVLRSAAHFGARAVLVGEGDVRLGGAAARTAEGGAEWVALVRVGSLVAAVERLRAEGFRVVATSSHGERSLHEERLSGRVALLLGSEREGLSSRLLEASDAQVAIPGTGAVESLNVSVAAGGVLAAAGRQQRAGEGPPAPRRGGPRGARSASGRESGGRRGGPRRSR